MKMISQLSHVMTLANSIIGVSVLAMPFCFKQCGILLATLVLLLCSVLSRLACHFLVKSAVMSRRRNFELLAFHAFGHMGKFLVELFIIGFLVGTCIAFFVVMGDLGPQIIGKMIDKNPADIRTSLLITTSVFIVLPLGLLRNIDSLSSICTATIVFYLCLVLKVMAESTQHIFAGDWYEHVYYWKPSGILQCLPIFSMALFCQTQLFEIYETIPNVSLEKMNEVVRGALNICTIVYLCVGFFGYIAFCTQSFTGNILMSFEPSLSSEMIKMGFVISVAFSFPLVIFPCRASLNSLLFRRVYTHEPSVNYLPEARFRCLTVAIVAMSLITGILIPNIEFVLGLVGSTIGVMICLIFPAVFFISISSKHTNERLLAQVILFIGICIMILGTYANLYAMEESTNTKILATTNKPLSQINNLPLNLNKNDIPIMADVPINPEILPNVKGKIDQLPDVNAIDKTVNAKAKDVRQEPPVPVERIVVTEKAVAGTQRPVDNLVTFAPEIKKIVDKIKTLGKDLTKDPKVVAKDDSIKAVESMTLKAEEKINIIEQKEKSADMLKNDNLINSDAIKKEESELAADVDDANILAAERREELRKTLEKHKLEQLQMIREQKEILKDIKEQKQEIEREKLRKAKDVEELKKTETKPEILDRSIVLEGNVNNAKSVKPDNETDRTKQSQVHGDKQIFSHNEALHENKLNEKVEETHDRREPEPAILEKNKLKNISKLENVQNIKRDVTNVPLLAKDFKKMDVSSNTLTQKQNNEKLTARLNNSGELLKGPILNVLTKRTLQKPFSADELAKIDNNNRNQYEVKHIPNNAAANFSQNVNVKNEDRRIQDQYSLPIALKMRNQTKMENTSVQLSNNKDDDNNVQVIRRDILADHEREKREINTEVEEIDAKVTTDAIHEKNESPTRSSSVNDDQNNCVKPQEDIHESEQMKRAQKLEENLSNVYSTEMSLIKTNVYLSDQQFADAISVDPNVALRGEYVKVKQRDLKALETSGNRDT